MLVAIFAKKLKIKATKDNQSEWIALKGEGRLLEPSEEVMDAVNKSDEVFSQYNGQKLSLRQASDPLSRVQRLIAQPRTYPQLPLSFANGQLFG